MLRKDEVLLPRANSGHAQKTDLFYRFSIRQFLYLRGPRTQDRGREKDAVEERGSLQHAERVEDSWRVPRASVCVLRVTPGVSR